MAEIIVSDDIVQQMSVLWVQKMYTFFRMYDEEGKGFFIQSEAGEAFGKRAGKFLKPDQMKDYQKAAVATFEHFFRPASVTHGGRTVVLWGDYIEDRVRACTVERAEDERKFSAMLDTFFDFIDYDGNHILSAEEVIAAESIFGLTPREARLNLASVDKRCDGRVTIEEYKNNWFKHFYSTEWDDSTLAFGKLLTVHVNVINPHSIKYHAEVPQDILTDMGELWVRKMLTVFRHYDVEGTGVLDLDDMVKVVTKRIQNKLTKDVFLELQNSGMGALFTTYAMEPAVSEENGREVVKWIDFLKTRYGATNENRCVDEQLLKDMHEAQLKGVDMNKDASIQLEEYMILAQVRGLTRHQSVVSFANIDINCDGNISYAENLEAQRLFYYSKEWDMGTLLYGTLDNARIVAV